MGPNISMGMGKTMVEPLSAAMMLRVWRYRSCMAVEDWEMVSAASFRARAAFSSPVAAITYTMWFIGKHVMHMPRTCMSGMRSF